MAEQVGEVQVSPSTEVPAGGASPEGGGSQGSGVPAANAEGGTPSPVDSGEKKPEPASPSEIAPPVEGEPEKAAAYKAREKFKSMDIEHDVPDFIKPLIKDAESEKQVIKLLGQAYALEPVRGKLDEAKRERDQLRTDYSSVQKGISDVRTAYQRGDIDTFLEKLAIPQERMLQWALEKVNYSQLPPEQQKLFDERREAQRKAWSEEQRAGSFEQQLQEQSRQAKAALLDSGLTRPDISAFQQAFDAKAGTPGAFRKEVVEQGELAWIQSNGKVDLSPEQAIERAIAKWRTFMAAPTAQPAAAAPGPQAAPAAKPSVIPNVQGGSQSPMKAGPRSIEDLKKLSKAAS